MTTAFVTKIMLELINVVDAKFTQPSHFTKMDSAILKLQKNKFC